MSKLSKDLKQRIVVAVTSEKYGKELVDAIESAGEVLSGTTAPSNSIGANGNFYINLTNGDIYVKYNNLWDLKAIGGVTGGANIGTSGVGLYDSLFSGNLQFKNINSGSSKITVTNDPLNKEVDIDVDESQIDVRNLTNVVPHGSGNFAAWDTLGRLNKVPGWAYDDDGSLRVGAQNSIAIPAGTTDYISIGVSPTVSNPGVVNLTGIQFNTPIDQPVGQYAPFQAYGYGTSAPLLFKGVEIQPNYSGTGGDLEYFRAGSGYDVTGSIRGFVFNGVGNGSTLEGLSITHNGNFASYIKLIDLASSGDTLAFTGMALSTTGNHNDVTGISIDLSGATSVTKKIGLSINGGLMTVGGEFETTSSLPSVVEIGNLIRPIFLVKPGFPISNTDVIANNFTSLINLEDDYSSGLIGLGITSLASAPALAVVSGRTADHITSLVAGGAIDATSGGGTVTKLDLLRTIALNLGGSLNIGTIYGVHVESGMSALATLAFGIVVEDTGAENWLAKCLKIGGSTKVVSDSTIALEIGGTKSLRLAVLTTAQRLALPNLAGTIVYDSDIGKAYLNNGIGWNQFG